MTHADDALFLSVQEALDRDVRPRLQAHMGDISIVDVTAEGDVVLHFLDACHNCQSRATTAALGVIPVIEAVPGVRSAKIDNVWVSRAALDRLAKMAAPTRSRLGVRDGQS